MTTLEIILTITLYTIIAMISYESFVKLTKKKSMRNPGLAIAFWPLMWFILTIIAIFTGYVEMFDDEDEEGRRRV